MENNKKIIVPANIMAIYKELSIYRTYEWLSSISEDEAKEDVKELRLLISIGAISVTKE